MMVACGSLMMMMGADDDDDKMITMIKDDDFIYSNVFMAVRRYIQQQQ